MLGKFSNALASGALGAPEAWLTHVQEMPSSFVTRLHPYSLENLYCLLAGCARVEEIR